MFNAVALEAWLFTDSCCLIGWNQKTTAVITVRMNMFIQIVIMAGIFLKMVRGVQCNMALLAIITVGITESGAAA